MGCNTDEIDANAFTHIMCNFFFFLFITNMYRAASKQEAFKKPFAASKMNIVLSVYFDIH